MATLKNTTTIERKIINCHCCSREASADLVTVTVASPDGSDNPLWSGCWVQPPPWWFVTGHTEDFAAGERAGLVFRCPVCSGNLRKQARKAKAEKCGH